MKTTVATICASTLLAGCALSSPIAPAPGAIHYGSKSGQLIAIDSTLKVGSSRDDLLKAVTSALQAQLSGGVEANAVVVTSRSPARYPLDGKAPSLRTADPANFDSAARRSAFVIDGKALTCTGSALVAHGHNTDSATTGEKAHVFACVLPFDGGYRTVIYAHLEESIFPSMLNKNRRFDRSSFPATTFGTVESAIKAHSSRTKIATSADILPN